MSTSHDRPSGQERAAGQKMLTCQQLGNSVWSVVLILAGHMSPRDGCVYSALCG